ncbi:MAG: amidase [Gemmatales bacterium]|nr:amidase [Gemmatales bacterium]MDW7994389.1 amidase [Gemmatales bacterium]
MSDIFELGQQLRRKQLSAQELTRQCLDRIRAEDPHLRAWALVAEREALEQARQCDEELTHGLDRGLLHGIPIGVKDIIDVAGWPTRFGVSHSEAAPRKEDAYVVARLRQAGAVLLGKTVTTPYAAFDPPPTRHPWLPGRTPGGSSSGSAVAVARNMCYAALATQTGGSITRPAAYCGIASIKPTFGRVSTRGVLPLAPHLDHVGAMGQTVRDLAIIFHAIAGFDPSDPSSINLPVPPLQTLLQPRQTPPRLGLLSGPWDEYIEKKMQQALFEACQTWHKHGASVHHLRTPREFDAVLQWHRTILAVEAAAYHESNYRRAPYLYPPKLAALLEEGLRTPAVEYARSRQHQETWRHEMLACFTEVDVFITPAASGPPPSADTTGDPCCNAPWSYLGYPTVSFPITRHPTPEPLAVQFIGRPFCEAELLATALWCEHVLHSMGNSAKSG